MEPDNDDFKLQDNDNIRKVIENEALVDAVLDYKLNFEAFKSDECPPLDYGPLPHVPFGPNGGLLRTKALKSFCAEFKGKSAKEVLSLCLTERDYWKPTGSVLITEFGELQDIRYEIGSEMSQLEHIEKPTLIRFIRADDEKLLIGPARIQYDLRELFNFFYDSQLVEEEDLNRAFNKQLDRLKNPVEESDTSERKNNLPPPFFGDYKEDLVKISAGPTSSVNQHLLNDAEKDRVLVVSGESGSGKSFFSAFGVHKGVPRLYVALSEKDVDTFNKDNMKEDEEEWLKHLTRILDFLENDKSCQDKYTAFQTARRKLRTRRNNAAWDVLKGAIDKLNDPNGVQLGEWFDGRLQANPLEEFLLVVDEVGRSPDVAHGLVDGGLRKLQEALVANGIAKKVGLVLCGTSLDQLSSTSSDKKYLGSDPSMSHVVIMEQTNLCCPRRRR